MAPPARRLIVLRTSRDTLALVACAVGVTLAMAYVVRQRPAPVATTPPAQLWAGQLAEVDADVSVPAGAEAMSSASLVVPKAAMALPAAPPPSTPARAGRTSSCDGPSCPAKASATPPPRQKAGATTPELERSTAEHVGKPATKAREKDRRFGLADLNPLPHLPDVVRKPFSYAGAKISGLIDWF